MVGDEAEQVYVSRDHRGSGVTGTLLTEAGPIPVPCHRYVKDVG